MIDIIPWFSYNCIVKKILLFLIPFVAMANSTILTTIPTPTYHYPAKTSFDIQREIQPDFKNKIPSVLAPLNAKKIKSFITFLELKAIPLKLNS